MDGKDTVTLNASGKEFHVIIPIRRTQYFDLDLFTRKILMVVGPCIMAINLIINK